MFEGKTNLITSSFSTTALFENFCWFCALYHLVARNYVCLLYAAVSAVVLKTA